MRPVFLVLRSGADDGAGPVQRGGSGGSVIIYFPRFPSKRFAFGPRNCVPEGKKDCQTERALCPPAMTRGTITVRMAWNKRESESGGGTNTFFTLLLLSSSVQGSAEETGWVVDCRSVSVSEGCSKSGWKTVGSVLFSSLSCCFAKRQDKRVERERNEAGGPGEVVRIN